ncbi:unnamed protein product [Symbiodinium natans]|uniref:Uncharacterized protein n=1 Tax=Symbiodinium natans TaxID=878477 RepID=A0A812R962_9DINO|nr:unnamed protein product [Symbiodinium natans]
MVVVFLMPFASIFASVCLLVIFHTRENWQRLVAEVILKHGQAGEGARVLVVEAQALDAAVLSASRAIKSHNSPEMLQDNCEFLADFGPAPKVKLMLEASTYSSLLQLGASLDRALCQALAVEKLPRSFWHL